MQVHHQQIATTDALFDAHRVLRTSFARRHRIDRVEIDDALMRLGSTMRAAKSRRSMSVTTQPDESADQIDASTADQPE